MSLDGWYNREVTIIVGQITESNRGLAQIALFNRGFAWNTAYLYLKFFK